MLDSLYKNLWPPEVQSLLEKQNVFILDVRTQREFEQVALPGAHLIPLPELAQRLDELPTDPDHEILVYCAHGRRSLVAADLLAHAGFQKLYNMAGGLAAYLGIP